MPVLVKDHEGQGGVDMALAPLSAAIEAMARRGEWRAHFPDGAMRMLLGEGRGGPGDRGSDIPPETFQFFRAPDLRRILQSDADPMEWLEPETVTLHAIHWSHVTRTVEYGTEERVREVDLRRRAAARVVYVTEEEARGWMLGQDYGAVEARMLGSAAQSPQSAPAPSLPRHSWEKSSYVPDWKTPEGEGR